MNINSNNFILSADIPWQPCGDGLQRKIMGYNAQLMMVRVQFKENAIAPVHSHFHTQVTYIISGRFKFTISGEEKEVGPGESVYITPNLQHGAICLEAGELIDVFSPFREDFL